MNQADYISRKAAIEAGDAAQSLIRYRFDDIITAADLYFESRKSDYDVAFPLIHGMRCNTPQSIFDMQGGYHSHHVEDRVIYLTFERSYSDSDVNHFLCHFPESLIWATDGELTTYLKGEFDRIIAEKVAKDRAAQQAATDAKLLTVAPHHVKTGRGKSAPKRFLDVGAGYGTKVILAKTILDQVTDYSWHSQGIEIEKRYVDARVTKYVELANGLTYGNYASYDIIYLYCPFSDAALQIKLQQAIIDGARPGAIVIFAGCCKVMTGQTTLPVSATRSDVLTLSNPFTDQMELVKVSGLGKATYHFNGLLDRMIWRKVGYAAQSAPVSAPNQSS